MKKILNALFLTIVSLVIFSCSDVPAPYDINEGGAAGLEGDGTYDNPYSVADAIKTQNGNAAWVKGYIVGIMGNKYKPDGVTFDGNIPVFTPPFTIATNVLIAATPDETNAKKCLPVKIKNGSDLANAINLVSHPDNLGQPLIIKGKLAAGFGMPSLIETTGAFFNGETIGEGGGGTPAGTVVVTTDKPYNVSFASSLGDFKVENKLSEGLKGDVWYISTKYTCVTASGYTGTPGVNVPAEGWLLSPILDLTALNKAALTFVQSSYNQGTAEELMLKIKESSAADWTDLTIPNYSSKRDDKVTSIVDLTSYASKKVQIAFVYKTAKTTDANTWYIYNLAVAAGEGGGTDPEPEFPTSGLGSKDEPYDVNAVLIKQDETKAWVKGFIVGGVNSANSGSSVDAADDVIFGTDGIRNSAIVIAASKDETDYKKCLIIGFAADSGDAKAALNLVDHKDNLGKEVKLGGVFKNAFSAPGMKTITAYELVAGGTDPDPDPEPTTGELFISEYVEGSGNNKYLEIYNPTGQAVDLSSYVLKLELNGAGVWTKELALTGSLASHAVIVYKNSSALLYTGEAIVNNDVINFNGDDPIGLFKDGVLIDMFGVSGSAGNKFAIDQTFRRKSTVKAPSATYNVDEWDVLPKDDVTGLGAHTMN